MKVGIYLLIILALAAPQASALPDVLTLSGVVTDASSHAPIALATVSVVGGRAVQDEVTDSHGVFVLTLVESVRPGDIVRLRIQVTDYETYDENVVVSAGGKLPNPISLRNKLVTSSKPVKRAGSPSKNPPVVLHNSPGSAVSYGQKGGTTAGTIINLAPQSRVLTEAALKAFSDQLKTTVGSLHIKLDTNADDAFELAQQLCGAARQARWGLVCPTSRDSKLGPDRPVGGWNVMRETGLRRMPSRLKRR